MDFRGREIVFDRVRAGLIFAVLAATLLVSLLLAIPVLAKATATAKTGSGDSNVKGGDVNVQYVDCSQVVNAVAKQEGNATAIGGNANATSGEYANGDSGDANASADAVADVANDRNISVEQVNACLGGINAGGTGTGTGTGTTSPASVDNPKDVMNNPRFDGKTLSDTGGTSLGLLTLGLFLMGGGLLLCVSLRRES